MTPTIEAPDGGPPTETQPAASGSHAVKGKQRVAAALPAEPHSTATAGPWRPYTDEPLVTPAMTLGPDRVPEAEMQPLRRYLAALVAVRSTPVHINVAFNACYFGYDLTTGYAGTTLDPNSFPTVTLGQTIDALPVGALVNVATGNDPIWAEVVYKEGAHPDLGENGSVPSWLSGAPAGATGPAQTENLEHPVLRERLVLDMDVFGLAPSPTQLARLKRRGRWLNDDGHLLVDSRYTTAEQAELDDVAFYRHHLLGAGRDLLFSTTAPAPLPLMLIDDAGPAQHDAALAGLFDTVTAALCDLDSVRMWQSYAVTRAALSGRILGKDPLCADELASLVTSTARNALPDPRRRYDTSRRVTYTAIGRRLRCIDGCQPQLQGAAYVNTVVQSNMIFADCVRRDAEDGLLFGQVHLRLDDAWQGGGIWRAETPGSAHALVDPTQPRGLGWAETLAPPAPLPTDVDSDPEPEPGPEPEEEVGDSDSDDLEVTDSQISWTVPLRASHIDTGVLTLPVPAARALISDGRDGTRMRLLLAHDGYELDILDTQQVAFVELHQQPAMLTGVSWPMEFFPGIQLTVTWPRNTATLRITSTLLDMPATIDGELEIEHCYDPRIVTRDALDRSSGPAEATLAQRIMKAVRRLGLVDADGIARLARDELPQTVYGSRTAQTEQALVPIVTQLLERGSLTTEAGSRCIDGTLSYPARPGEPAVELVCYIPQVVTGPLRPRRFQRLEAHFVSTHLVSGFLRRIDHLGYSASPQARAAYREYRARHGLAGPAELPEGWTFVRPHERGGA